MNPRSSKPARTHSKASHVLALHDLDIWHKRETLAKLVSMAHLEREKEREKGGRFAWREVPRAEGGLKLSYGDLKLSHHLLHQIQTLILLYCLPQAH